jgi:hypothetical protein
MHSATFYLYTVADVPVDDLAFSRSIACTFMTSQALRLRMLAIGPSIRGVSDAGVAALAAGCGETLRSLSLAGCARLSDAALAAGTLIVSLCYCCC